MKKKNFKPFISGNKVIVDLESKIDILVDNDVYLVSKNSKPLYYFDDSDNAILFSLLIYLDCIGCSFMNSKLFSLSNYFSQVEDLLTMVSVRQILYPEVMK